MENEIFVYDPNLKVIPALPRVSISIELTDFIIIIFF